MSGRQLKTEVTTGYWNRSDDKDLIKVEVILSLLFLLNNTPKVHYTNYRNYTVDRVSFISLLPYLLVFYCTLVQGYLSVFYVYDRGSLHHL